MLGYWTSNGVPWILENFCIRKFFIISVKIIFKSQCSIKIFFIVSHLILKRPQSFLLNPALLWSDEDPSNWINLSALFPLLIFDHVAYIFVCDEFPVLKRAWLVAASSWSTLATQNLDNHHSERAKILKDISFNFPFHNCHGNIILKFYNLSQLVHKGIWV